MRGMGTPLPINTLKRGMRVGAGDAGRGHLGDINADTQNDLPSFTHHNTCPPQHHGSSGALVASGDESKFPVE